MKKSVLIILVFLFFINGCRQSEVDQIDDLLKPLIENDLFHGRVLVAKEGNIIYNKGFGYANIEWKIPNVEDTKFRIASISKQFTAFILLQLAEEGKIDLMGNISDYLPEYRKDTGEKVTIHHLLTHTSGIPKCNNKLQEFWRGEYTKIHYDRKEFIKKFCSGDLEFEPGSQFRYTSAGYIILGAIIEEICGKSFPDVFAERVAKKIGLYNTVCDNNISLVANRASGYSRDDFGWKNSVYHYMPILDGAGTILTTVEDLYKYDQALYTDRNLPQSYREQFFRKYDLFDHPFFRNGGYYSYGWEIFYLDGLNSNDSLKIISHRGGIRGGSAFFGRQIEKNNSVIILSNTEIGSPLLRAVGIDFFRVLNNQYPKYEYGIPIRHVIGKEIIESGLEAAITKYYKLKNEKPILYDFRQSQLNSLGYSLINKGLLSDSIEIFKLNVKIYPNYANGYDSLGEAYMINGDKELAIKSYEKSVELDPNNRNAIDALKKLKEN